MALRGIQEYIARDANNIVSIKGMHTVNPSFEATPFASEKWPYKRGGLLSGVKINTFIFRLTL